MNRRVAIWKQGPTNSSPSALSWIRGNRWPLALLCATVFAWFLPWLVRKYGHGYQPGVGVYVTVMAVVAAWMTLRREPSKFEKSCWLILIMVLAVLEIGDINTATTRQIHTFSAISRDLDESRKGLDATAAGIRSTAKAMDAVAGLSAKELSVSGDALRQLTGGGEFCYLDTLFGISSGSANGKVLWPVTAYTSGTLPMDDCYVVINENFPIRSPSDIERRMKPIVVEQLGPLTPAKTPGRPGAEGITTNIVLPTGDYDVHIDTRNARFYELLKIGANGATEIDVLDDAGKVVYKRP